MAVNVDLAFGELVRLGNELHEQELSGNLDGMNATYIKMASLLHRTQIFGNIRPNLPGILDMALGAIDRVARYSHGIKDAEYI